MDLNELTQLRSMMKEVIEEVVEEKLEPEFERTRDWVLKKYFCRRFDIQPTTLDNYVCVGRVVKRGIYYSTKSYEAFMNKNFIEREAKRKGSSKPKRFKKATNPNVSQDKSKKGAKPNDI